MTGTSDLDYTVRQAAYDRANFAASNSSTNPPAPAATGFHRWPRAPSPPCSPCATRSSPRSSPRCAAPGNVAGRGGGAEVGDRRQQHRDHLGAEVGDDSQRPNRAQTGRRTNRRGDSTAAIARRGASAAPPSPLGYGYEIPTGLPEAPGTTILNFQIVKIWCGGNSGDRGRRFERRRRAARPRPAQPRALQRMTARVLAALLFTEQPTMTMAELADQLQAASSGAISGAVKMLTASVGLAERVPAPASRRDHYRLRDDAWALLFTNQNAVHLRDAGRRRSGDPRHRTRQPGRAAAPYRDARLLRLLPAPRNPRAARPLASPVAAPGAPAPKPAMVPMGSSQLGEHRAQLGAQVASSPGEYIGPAPSDSSRRSRATPRALTGRRPVRRPTISVDQTHRGRDG